MMESNPSLRSSEQHRSNRGREDVRNLVMNWEADLRREKRRTYVDFQFINSVAQVDLYPSYPMNDLDKLPSRLFNHSTWDVTLLSDRHRDDSHDSTRIVG